MDDLKNARNLVKGSFLTIASNVINGTIGFLTSVFIAKTLGSENYGHFVLALAVFGAFLTASSLGIGQAAAKYIGGFVGQRKYAAAAGVLKTSTTMAAVIFSISAIVLYVSSGLIATVFAKDLSTLLRIMAPGILLGGLMGVIMSSLQGFQLFGSYALTELVHNSGKLAAIVLLIWGGFGAAGAMAGIVIGYGLAVAFGFTLLRRGVHLEKKEHAVEPARIIRMGLPLAVTGYMLFLTTRSSTYLLGIFATSAEVGVYAATLIFAYEFFVLSDALNAAFFPVFSAVHGGGTKSSFANFFEYSLKFGAVLVLPIVVYVGIFAPQITGLVLGSDYAQIGGVLRILTSLGLSYFLYSVCLSALIAMGKTVKVAFISLAPLLAVLVGGRFLIPNYGIAGAAATDSLAFVLGAAVAVFALKQEKITRFPLRTLSRIVLSALGMGVFLFLTNGLVTTLWAGLLLSLASVVVYIILLLAFQSFEKKDVRVLENIFIGSRTYPLVRRLCGIMRIIAR